MRYLPLNQQKLISTTIQLTTLDTILEQMLVCSWYILHLMKRSVNKKMSAVVRDMKIFLVLATFLVLTPFFRRQFCLLLRKRQQKLVLSYFWRGNKLNQPIKINFLKYWRPRTKLITANFWKILRWTGFFHVGCQENLDCLGIIFYIRVYFIGIWLYNPLCRGRCLQE